VREGFLHEILGVQRVARPDRQATVSPPLQARQVACAQLIQRTVVTAAGAFDERERGLGFVYKQPRGLM
jgi:hypothetical protein